MKTPALLLLVILLEGYIVLSTELLAIRLTMPFVGSGADTVAIIIAAVLMPLALGYYKGGQYKTGRIKDSNYSTVRKKLIKNLMISAIFLSMGLSYYIVHAFFEFFTHILNYNNRLLLTTLYSVLFIVTPVYLLGQTVPLISNYYRRERISEAAGKILFFSTIGSFGGAVLSTLLFMNYLGVNQTASISIAATVFLVFLLESRKMSPAIAVSGVFMAFALIVNSPAMMHHMGIQTMNIYNNIKIYDRGPVRFMDLNHSPASTIFIDNPEKPVTHYRRFIENYFIHELKDRENPGRILILGAGGFTIGLKDKVNNYIFVDIDPDLQKISEEQFLKKPLPENKVFKPLPARAFFTDDTGKFDIIVMDITGNITGTPDHLISYEFFETLNQHLKDDGAIFINIYASVLFEDAYSRNLDNTIRSVFPYMNRQTVTGSNIWRNEKSVYKAVLYYGEKRPKPSHYDIYTDNKNRAGIDKALSISH